MKALILVSDAYGGYGGIAKYNRDLINALCARPDCEEVVAIPRHMPFPYPTLPENLIYDTSGLDSKLRYVLAILKVVLRDRSFDLVVCAHINLLPIAWLARIWIRAPIVLFIHGIDAWKPTKSCLTNLLAQRIHYLVSVSELTKERFLQWKNYRGKNQFVLHNAIDIGRYTPGARNGELLERYGLGGKTILVTVGRLVGKGRYKGVDEVLQILPELIDEVPNIAYLIVGNGPDRQRLEQKAEALGIADLVTFAGLIQESEIVDHYRLADAFILPGKGEGFGFVYLEAMACGIPVVASKLDGSREAVREGSLGILVDPDDPEDIKAGILRALEQPKGIVPEGLEYFAYEQFQKRWWGIVDEILGNSE